MSVQRLFTEHPASVGESYFQHLNHAGCFAARMLWGGFACLVHALLPFMFVKTGSEVITELNDRMVVNRARQSQSKVPSAQLPS